ncbi:MAG: DUF427 domain-containing protein [bacterium]|nr:DUF427 domain-containing protein [bacterium]
MRKQGLPQPDPAGLGQESVWDYPRPPALEPAARRVCVTLGGVVIAESSQSVRVLETSHPPTYYVPPADTAREYFSRAPGRSFCEWKGSAAYWTVSAGGLAVVGRAWSYPQPIPAFADLANYVSFYPADFSCFLDDEVVRPQPGRFYGGWVTGDIVGPFKGVPGSERW